MNLLSLRTDEELAEPLPDPAASGLVSEWLDVVACLIDLRRRTRGED